MLDGSASRTRTLTGDRIADCTISSSLPCAGPVHGAIDPGTEDPILRSDVGESVSESGLRMPGCTFRTASEESSIRSLEYGPAELGIPAGIET